MNHQPLFSLDILSEGVLLDNLELRCDDDGGLWLNDEPMTVMEARHFWSIIKFAMNSDSELDPFKNSVERELADAGTLAACARGWHG